MKRSVQNLVIISIVLLVVLNYPFVSVANRGANFGTLFLFLFIIWFLAIGLAYFFIFKGGDDTDE